MSSKLYIIGNGFDLYHNMQTSFADFRVFAETNARDTFNAVESYLSISDDWADLELALADLDVDFVIEDLGHFMLSYSADDWSESGHHDFQYEVGRVVEYLSSELICCLKDWISQVKIPDKDSVRRLKTINQDAFFLTFNYTSTLAYLYDIAANRTLHIHGSIADPEQKIILGHAWNPVNRKSLNDRQDIEVVDIRLMEANSIIDQYFSSTFKPSRQLIDDNRSFFERLCGVSEVVVLGHSLSVIDAEYYRELLTIPSITTAKWTVACRPEDNHQEKIQRLVGFGISLPKVNLIDWSYIK